MQALLPIYAEKDRVIAAIKGNDVVVIKVFLLCKNLFEKRLVQPSYELSQAATGTGKSTQLAQYILDEVMDEEDKRKIAVLEPRRVNAQSLASRVAHERNGKVTACPVNLSVMNLLSVFLSSLFSSLLLRRI
jgi:hypothetical protein